MRWPKYWSLGELGIGLQCLGNRGDNGFADISVRAKAHSKREVVVRFVSLVYNLEVEGFGHYDTSVVLALVKSLVQDGRREGAEDIAAAARTAGYPV